MDSGGECSRRMRSIKKVGSVKQRGRRTHARHALAVDWLREREPRISGHCQYARTRKLLCFRALLSLSMRLVTEFVPGAHHRHYTMRSCAQAHPARSEQTIYGDAGRYIHDLILILIDVCLSGRYTDGGFTALAAEQGRTQGA
jgi:hypothetical protein